MTSLDRIDIQQLGEGYLTAEGYQVSRRSQDLLVGKRLGLGETNEFVYAWIPPFTPQPPDLRSREADYLRRFQEATEAEPSAQRFLIVPSTTGFSREFRQGASRWHSVKVVTPIQFFDTSFRWEESPQAPSAARALRERGQEAISGRVRQPYVTKSAANLDEEASSGDDLLDDLYQAYRGLGPNRTPVSVVVGPAGIGKSYFFEAFFARLHSAFIEDKQALRFPALRPLPLLPENLRAAESPTMRALQRSFLQTEFARPLTGEVFEWLITHDLAIWMLDGLDEVISTDIEFFDYLLDLMTKPGGTSPRIVICVRDSLFSTNTDFREFCEDFEDNISIYQLQPWSDSNKRAFARSYFPQYEEGFTSALRQNAAANSLAATPYYCQLLADDFRENGQLGAGSETDLLQRVLMRTIERDYEKEFVDRSLVSVGEVLEFLEAVAFENFKGGLLGVPVDVPREMAEIILPSDLESSHQTASINNLTNLAVFAPTHGGNVRFAQENLEQYLIGRAAISGLDNADRLVKFMSIRLMPSDWISTQIIAKTIRDMELTQFIKHQALFIHVNSIAFRNLIQLLALAAKEPAVLRGIDLKYANLQSVKFANLNLSGVSFIGSDLTDAEFIECNSQDADFTDAIIKGTRLRPSLNGLRGANFGPLTRFYSLITNKGQHIASLVQAAAWLKEQTKQPGKHIGPCPAAMQVRHLFMKFIRPDGSARRFSLDRRGAISGKQHANREAALKSALRYGYLEQASGRDHVSRASGALYNEMVQYVVDLNPSQTIRNLIADLCEQPSCEHLPTVAA